MKTKLIITALAFVATLGVATAQNQNQTKKTGNNIHSTRAGICRCQQ